MNKVCNVNVRVTPTKVKRLDYIVLLIWNHI